MNARPIDTASTNDPRPAPAPEVVPDLATLDALAARAVSALRALEGALPLDYNLPPAEYKAALVGTRVSTEAIAAAADIAEEQPARFPQYDLAGARDALRYELALGRVGTAARNLASRIDRTIMKKRGKAAHESLALYATAKGLSRFRGNEDMREGVKTLAQLVAPSLRGKRKKESTAKAGAPSPVPPANDGTG